MDIPWDCDKCGSQGNLTDAVCPNCGNDRTAPEPKPAARRAREAADA